MALKKNMLYYTHFSTNLLCGMSYTHQVTSSFYYKSKTITTHTLRLFFPTSVRVGTAVHVGLPHTCYLVNEFVL